VSRSFKKHPACPQKPRRSLRETKRFVSKSVRNVEDVSNGRSYRKLFDSWDICDGVSLCSLDEWIRRYNRDDWYTENIIKKRYPTLNDWIKQYHKAYTRK
jgi:hypothetical protein